MANTRRRFGLLASGMVWSVAASAANYHVNGSIGVDSRTTVEAQNSTSPWRSIQKCNQNAMPGDTCLIHSGTYAEYIAPASGLNGAYVTFQALPGHTVVMNGFRLDNQSYVKIGGDQSDEGLTLRMGPDLGAGLIEFANSAHHIIIQNNDIGGLKGVSNPSNHACIRQSGIGTQRSSYITIKNNRIAWCGSIPPNSETWRRSHFYAPGDFVHASTANKSVFLEATTGGLSGAAEPLWPTSGGATLTDGDGGLTWVSREFGLQSAVHAVGDRWLIEGNTIAHVSDFIAPYGTYMVIRNNTFGPVSCSDVGIANDDDPCRRH